MRSFVLYMTLAVVTLSVRAADWPQFRGPRGDGLSSDAQVPLKWSDTEGVKWKVELPGPGSSSPIIVGDRIFVTCYTGYGIPGGEVGNMADLKRHLLCLDRATGKEIWRQTLPAVQPEDAYKGYINEHGYASHTPVSDGKNVYVFYGKSGVHAYDFSGKELWQFEVGKLSGRTRWGSAASPILYGDVLIVNAADESRALFGLNKATGKKIWEVSSPALELCYATPLIVKDESGREDVVTALPGEIWGHNPLTGALVWKAGTQLTGNISPSVGFGGGMLVVSGGFPRSGSMGLKLGGSGDVTKTHTAWTSDIATYVPTPTIFDGNVYWLDDKAGVRCMEAKTGKSIFYEKLPITGKGKLVYASLVLAGDRFYGVTRYNGTYVFKAKSTYEQLAVNTFAGDATDFSATPAIADGQIFLRSNKCLYCLGK